MQQLATMIAEQIEQVGGLSFCMPIPHVYLFQANYMASFYPNNRRLNFLQCDNFFKERQLKIKWAILWVRRIVNKLRKVGQLCKIVHL